MAAWDGFDAGAAAHGTGPRMWEEIEIANSTGMNRGFMRMMGRRVSCEGFNGQVAGADNGSSKLQQHRSRPRIRGSFWMLVFGSFLDLGFWILEL